MRVHKSGSETAKIVSDMGCRALFLDRDGVINVDHGYTCTAERTEFVQGIFELCRTAQDAGYSLVIVTNQAGIGRGLYSESAYRNYMAWMQSVFAGFQIHFDGIYHCPHHPTAAKGKYRKVCNCRKPAPGLILRAAAEIGIDLANSLLVGDKVSDLEAGVAAGVGHSFLLRAQADAAELHGNGWSAVSDLEQIRALIASRDSSVRPGG